MRRNPFKSKNMEEYLKGYYDGREEAEMEAEKRMASVWEAVDRARDLAHNAEPDDTVGNYHAWHFLTAELDEIAARRPEFKKRRKPGDPYLDYYLKHHEQT